MGCSTGEVTVASGEVTVERGSMTSTTFVFKNVLTNGVQYTISVAKNCCLLAFCFDILYYQAGVAEQVDARDLKFLGG